LRKNIFENVDTLTFDCYGTLVDWSAGLRSAFRRIFGDALTGVERELFDAYVEIEAEVEAEGHRRYRAVLAETVKRLSVRFELEMPGERCEWLADALPTWEPFADTNAGLLRLKERFRLGVLSNIDRDLFAGTRRHFSVGFDFVITAEEVKSYKPAPGHFRTLLEHHASNNHVVHVAQSLYHDGAPAQSFGLPFVWINRYGQKNETAVKPSLEFPDLGSLADVACTPRSVRT